MRSLLLALALAVTAHAQPSADDVRIDGRSIVGVWEAVEVLGDWEASEDIRSGALTTVLRIEPGGAVRLRGTDWKRAQGRTVLLEGHIHDNRLRLTGLPGEAELQRLGPRLHLVDPRGRETVFERRW